MKKYPFTIAKLTKKIFFSKLGDPVTIPKSSFSLNEFWSNIQPTEKGNSLHDEGYLELQWSLPRDISLAEKFVLRFEQLLTINSANQAHDVFKVSKQFE